MTRRELIKKRKAVLAFLTRMNEPDPDECKHESFILAESGLRCAECNEPILAGVCDDSC